MITVFENEEFGAVRTATINGEPWFVANDVFRVLSVRNTKDALHTLDEDEKSGVDIIDPHGRVQRTNCISESGLYSIVLRSRKPEAKAFRRWITHEVIPAIRKHGMYATTPMLRQFQENPELIRLVCERMLAEKNRADKLDKKVTELQPKADFFDAFISRLCSEFSVNAYPHGKTVHILRLSEPEAVTEPPPLAARSVLDRLA